MKVIFIALVMLVFPAPVLAEQGDALNRPMTAGDLDQMGARLGAKLDLLGAELDLLGSELDAKGRNLGAKLDSLGERIDALTRVVWVAFGLIVVLFLTLVTLMHRDEKILPRD